MELQMLVLLLMVSLVSSQLTDISAPTNFKGEIGTTGDTGARGPQGPTGFKGSVGLTGPSGEKGTAGSLGARGPVGDSSAVGQKGDKGPAGIVGVNGDSGDKGFVGSQGVQGPPGPKGVVGPRGNPGGMGLPGARGPLGDSGLTGDQGETGMRGVKAGVGDPGELGPTGIQGSAGFPGAAFEDNASNPVYPDPCTPDSCAGYDFCNAVVKDNGARVESSCQCYNRKITSRGCTPVDQLVASQKRDCSDRNGGCEYMCANERCSCPGSGYTLKRGLCVDIDECGSPNICPSLYSCLNTMGSYRCVYNPGAFSGSGSANSQNEVTFKESVLINSSLNIILIVWLLILTLCLIVAALCLCTLPSLKSDQYGAPINAYINN